MACCVDILGTMKVIASTGPKKSRTPLGSPFWRLKQVVANTSETPMSTTWPAGSIVHWWAVPVAS
jgi:hypothetical protein